MLIEYHYLKNGVWHTSTNVADVLNANDEQYFGNRCRKYLNHHNVEGKTLRTLSTGRCVQCNEIDEQQDHLEPVKPKQVSVNGKTMGRPVMYTQVGTQRERRVLTRKKYEDKLKAIAQAKEEHSEQVKN